MTKLGKRYNEVWQIDKECADKLLANNYCKNRKLNKRNLNSIISDMERHKFVATPDPIIITKSGVLLNGQHRLTGVSVTGLPHVFEVRIVDDDSLFAYIDNGKARTANDYVEAKYSNTVVAVGRFAFCAENGVYGITAAMHGYVHSGQSYATRNEIVEYCNAHTEGLEKISADANKMHHAVGCGQKAIYGMALWLILMLNNDEVSEEFIEDFVKPASAYPTIIAGKSTLQKSYTGQTNPTKEWLMSMTLQMYEAFYAGRDLTRFSKSTQTLALYERKLKAWREIKRGYDDDTNR